MAKSSEDSMDVRDFHFDELFNHLDAMDEYKSDWDTFVAKVQVNLDEMKSKLVKMKVHSSMLGYHIMAMKEPIQLFEGKDKYKMLKKKMDFLVQQFDLQLKTAEDSVDNIKTNLNNLQATCEKQFCSVSLACCDELKYLLVERAPLWKDVEHLKSKRLIDADSMETMLFDAMCYKQVVQNELENPQFE